MTLAVSKSNNWKTCMQNNHISISLLLSGVVVGSYFLRTCLSFNWIFIRLMIPNTFSLERAMG